MRFIGKTFVSAGPAVLALSLACGGGGGGSAPAPAPTPIPTPDFTTLSLLAGAPSGAGNADGTGNAARFNAPYAVAVDGAGNRYVADGNNRAIRRITPAGASSTLQLTGPYTLVQPAGIAVDAAGDLFVTDAGGPLQAANVYEIVSGTTALTPMAPPAGGAGYGLPQGAAVDAKGDVYVADWDNQAVYEFVGGSSSTPPIVLPPPDNATGSYDSPAGVTVDVKGNVYVADAGEAGNPAVYVYSPSAGTNTTLATFGAASHPVGLAVDIGGNLFVMDGGNDEIYLMAAGGASPTALAGSGSPGSADGATSLSSSFRLDPEWGGMALFANGTSTTLFVTDTGNNTIRALAVAYPAPGSTSPITATVTTPLGQAGDPGSQDGPGTSALFNGPASVAVALSGPALGTAYVADTANNGIRAIVQAAGNGGTGATVTTLKVEPGNIGQVQAVAADGKGNVFVTDSENQAVFQLSPPTDPEGYWSAVQLASPGLGGYAAVNGVAVDGSGNVYVADSGGATVFKIDTSGNLTELPAPEVTDYTPAGVAVDAQGNVYVTDLLNGAVYQISGGVVYPLVGGFTWPVSVAAGAVGTIYVADQGGNEVRQLVITATGTGPTVQSTTLVGQVGVCGTAPGNLPAALANPAGVAVNPDGTLLVTVPDAVLKVQ